MYNYKNLNAFNPDFNGFQTDMKSGFGYLKLKMWMELALDKALLKRI